MKTKTKTMINSVLEKKLEELESLRESISFNDDDDPNVYRDIELRVIFAKTLLAAEISSRIDIKGEEVDEERLKLSCMVNRLDELDEAFKTNRVYGHDDNGSVTEPGTESLETNDDGVVGSETGSVKSWVESCQDKFGKTEEGQEEEEEEEKEEDAEQWPLFQDAEEKTEATSPVRPPAEEREVVVVRELKEKGRVSFRALVCFGLIGLVGGMVCLLGYIGNRMEEDDFFLTPT